MKKIAVTVMIGLAATFTMPVFAKARLQGLPKVEWMKGADAKAKIEAQGYAINRFKVDGNCYEIYGKNKEGKKVEIYFDAKTLERDSFYSDLVRDDGGPLHRQAGYVCRRRGPRSADLGSTDPWCGWVCGAEAIGDADARLPPKRCAACHCSRPARYLDGVAAVVPGSATRPD